MTILQILETIYEEEKIVEMLSHLGVSYSADVVMKNLNDITKNIAKFDISDEMKTVCVKDLGYYELERLCDALHVLVADADRELARRKQIRQSNFDAACRRYRAMMAANEGKSFEERRDAINRFRSGY